jgi:hypothetical protein
MISVHAFNVNLDTTAQWEAPSLNQVQAELGIQLKPVTMNNINVLPELI